MQYLFIFYRKYYYYTARIHYCRGDVITRSLGYAYLFAHVGHVWILFLVRKFQKASCVYIIIISTLSCVYIIYDYTLKIIIIIIISFRVVVVYSVRRSGRMSPSHQWRYNNGVRLPMYFIIPLMVKDKTKGGKKFPIAIFVSHCVPPVNDDSGGVVFFLFFAGTRARVISINVITLSFPSPSSASPILCTIYFIIIAINFSVGGL